METTSRQTVSSFQKTSETPELKRAKTYSALSFDRINFFNIANFICFHFLGNPLLFAIRAIYTKTNKTRTGPVIRGCLI